MAKKKINIPEHKKKDLQGFEDLIEDYLEEGQVIRSKPNLMKEKDLDGHKTYNFLEIERERISKISTMISRRIPNIIEHNQSDEIIEKFTVYNYNLKEDIVRKVKRTESTFNQTLKKIFNNAFKK